MRNERLAQAARPVSLLLLVSYPLSVHLGVLTGIMWPALAVLAALVLLPPLMLRPGVARAVIFVAVFACGALFLQFAPQALLKVVYAPPVLLPLLLLWLFARSLRPGQEPFISRIARLMHSQPSARLLNYTRRVTLAWVFFLALLTVEAVWLGLYADRESWSRFTNFYNYLFMLAFFLLELLIRPLFVSPEERIPPLRFFRKLVSIEPRHLF
ncbi:MAG: hypothetical protein ACQETD_03115 [Pseudomonadota bacterium]